MARQRINNEAVFQSIRGGNMPLFRKNINTKEFVRVLLEVDMSEQCLLDRCRADTTLNRVLSGRISKNASRQGISDEETQLKSCTQTAAQLGITITNLSSIAYRPTKSGDIISRAQMKQRNIPKDACLKSFDGKISGAIDGWIFAKIVYGSGGHQDNVFEEADILGNWVDTYQRECNDIFVILIDTDLDTKLQCLKKKYQSVSNLFIGNHVEFQEYLIATY
tara:strand:+ start:6333 stop:6995 length:663 start_codon:yes stop_codon:yes gene_type:complete